MSDQTIEAEARAAVGGLARSGVTRQTSGGAVPEAIMFADDRFDRLGHTLDELDRIIGALADKAAPVLTGGQPTPLPPSPDTSAPASPEDTRSEVARRVAGLGVRADISADRVQSAIRRANAILDALEV